MTQILFTDQYFCQINFHLMSALVDYRFSPNQRFKTPAHFWFANESGNLPLNPCLLHVEQLYEQYSKLLIEVQDRTIATYNDWLERFLSRKQQMELQLECEQDSDGDQASDHSCLSEERATKPQKCSLTTLQVSGRKDLESLCQQMLL